VHARRAVRPARAAVDRTNLVAERSVGLSTRRRWPIEPRVVPADGHSSGQYVMVTPWAARCALTKSNPSAGSSRSPERTRPRQFRGLTLLAQALHLPVEDASSLRAPPSQSALTTTDIALGLRDSVADRLGRRSNFSASSSGLRPGRTSSTIRRRDSGGYGVGLVGRVGSSLAERGASSSPTATNAPERATSRTGTGATHGRRRWKRAKRASAKTAQTASSSSSTPTLPSSICASPAGSSSTWRSFRSICRDRTAASSIVFDA
jgi:hypothetical protein